MKNDLIRKKQKTFLYRVLRTLIKKYKNFIIVASHFIKFVYDSFSLMFYIEFMTIFYYSVLRIFVRKSKANIVCFAHYYKRQLI